MASDPRLDSSRDVEELLDVASSLLGTGPGQESTLREILQKAYSLGYDSGHDDALNDRLG